jgi:hypothetical protein
MRSMSMAAALLLGLMNASCGGGPSEQDINNALEATLSSVTGPWSGIASSPSTARLDFQLQTGSNGQVTGSGTFKESNAIAAVPITVTGTFQRPNLTLVFNGIVYESRQVQGTAQGNYTSVGGISTTLSLSAVGYARDLPILLQEK